MIARAGRPNAPSSELVGNLPRDGGAYLLIFDIAEALTFIAGALGRVSLEPGRYGYVGSAHGPGGLRARVARHLRRDKRVHWHIDYLTNVCAVRAVVAQAGAQRMECAWIRHLLRLVNTSAPVQGFGSSDCREGCPAHLLRLAADFDGVTWNTADDHSR